MNIDLLTVIVGLGSFGIFLLVHVVTFRWVAPEHLLKSLLLCVIAVMALPVVFMGIFFIQKAVDAPLHLWICASLLAMMVDGLLCFVYVLCIFGPYETSVRMRLVREIAKSGPQGISLESLLNRYNAETIVSIRLQRLKGSGDIIEKDGRYQIANNRNFFFIFDAIAGILKKWIG